MNSMGLRYISINFHMSSIGMFKYISALSFVAVLAGSAAVDALPKPREQGERASCDEAKCVAGTPISLVVRKGEPYFVCPTLELVTYSNFVLGILAVNKEFSGRMSDVSPVTGEPELVGESKAMIDTLRRKARVSTFDGAVAKCTYGKNTSNLTVMNNADALYIWVGNGKTAFWVPKFAAHIRKKNKFRRRNTELLNSIQM
jgi:hypothetical protein